MGQRLNIEIWHEGEVIANAYYHWSAYTSDAIEMTNQIIDWMDFHHFENFKDEPLLYAVRALEVTGAGLTDKERPLAEHWLKTNDFAPCNGRDVGLISISADGIEETRNWEEGRVVIDLDDNVVDFNVYYTENKDDFIAMYNDINEIETVNVNLHMIPINDFCVIMESLPHNYFINSNIPEMVFCAIE